MAHDLFISYSTQDKAIADRLCHELEAKGVRCWIAPRDVAYGSDWQQSIMDAIASAKALVLVFSAGANTSSTVRKEVLAAVESNVLVIPFRVEDVRPQGALRFNLIDVHWLDAVTPPLDPHIDLLVERVARLTEDLEPDPEPTPRKRRRKTIDVVPPAEPEPEPESEDDEPTVDPTPPAPIPVPSPPVPPAPKPVLTDEEKQRRQTMMIIGGAVVGGLLLFLLTLYKPPAPPTPPGLLDSNIAANLITPPEPPPEPPPTAVSDIATQTSPDTKNRVVEVINQTGKPMVGLYASAPSAGWGANRMSGALASGSSYKFNISDGTEECFLDVKATFADGTYSSSMKFHVCGQSTLTLSTTTTP